MKQRLLLMLDFLNQYGILQTIERLFKFITELVIVLSVATFFMRFCIISGYGQTWGLIVGMVSAVGVNAYLRFQRKLY